MEKTSEGKLPLSRLHHVGIVVKDLSRAIQYYQSLGLGPFRRKETADLVEKTVYGKPADFKLNIAAAKLGDIGIELIQPVEKASPQEEFLKTRGEGINHIAFLVDDLKKEQAELIKRGFKVVLSGKRAHGAGGSYFDTREAGGVIIELIQP